MRKADYQLGGGYRLPAGVTVVSRDRTDRPGPVGRTTSATSTPTRPSRTSCAGGATTTRACCCATTVDWCTTRAGPGEVLLDTSTAAKRRGIAAVMGRWFARCAADGFDAVEPDNLDSHTRSRPPADTAPQPRAGATAGPAAPTATDLAIAQKNLADVSRARRLQIGFDFAVAEECQVWHECGLYRKAYGRHVIEIEYTDNGRAAYRQACRPPRRPLVGHAARPDAPQAEPSPTTRTRRASGGFALRATRTPRCAADDAAQLVHGSGRRGSWRRRRARRSDDAARRARATPGPGAADRSPAAATTYHEPSSISASSWPAPQPA